MTKTDVDAAAEVALGLDAINALVPPDPNEAEETQSDTEDAAVAQEEEAQDTEFPNLDIEVPEDLLEELEVPDEEEEVEEEDEEEEYEYEDAETLKAKNAKLARENQFLKEQKVRQGVKTWKQEALKYFPLSEYKLDEITATSRRSYLKQARAAEAAIKPTVQKLLGIAKATIDAEKEKARTEARGEVEKAWGKPTTGPGQPPSNADLSDVDVLQINDKGGLSAVFKQMMDSGKL